MAAAVTPRDVGNFFKTAYSQDPLTVARSILSITQITSERLYGEIQKVVDVFDMLEIFGCVNGVVSDLAHPREAGLKKIVSDVALLTCVAGGLALWLQTAGAINFVALVSLALVNELTLLTATIFFAIETYNAYTYTPLRGDQVTNLIDQTRDVHLNRNPDNVLSSTMPPAERAAKATAMADAKNASVEWALYANATKTALIAAPLLGITAPPLALALIAFTSGCASMMGLYNQYAAEKILKDNTTNYGTNILAQHVWKQIGSSTDDTAMTTVTSPKPAHTVAELPGWVASFFTANPKGVMQGVPGTLRLCDRYLSTDLSGLAKAVDKSAFFAICEFPKKAIGFAGVSPSSWLDLGILVTDLEALSAITNSVLSCLKWYDASMLSPMLKKYLKNYTKIFNLTVSTGRALYKLLRFNDPAKQSLEIMRNLLAIGMLMILTEVPMIQYIPEKWEKALLTDIAGASILATNFIIHLVSEYSAHNVYKTKYDEARASD